MNYCLHVSNGVEEKLQEIGRPPQWTQEDEGRAYRNPLDDVIQEDEGRTWAAGNVRIRDYIFLNSLGRDVLYK